MARARKLVAREIEADAPEVVGAAGLLPADHPAILPDRIGVGADEPRHAGCHRLLVDAPLSGEFLSDKRVIDYPSLAVAAAAAAGDPEQAPVEQGPRLRHDLEQGARREPAPRR